MRNWIDLCEEKVETAIVEGVTEKLFRKYGGTMMPFDELPVSAQSAIRHYMTVDGDNHEYDKSNYGFVMIPAKALIRVCWNATDNNMQNEYENWDEYHGSYWDGESDTDYADHLQQMWPVILYDGEGILDGWHRFHWYLRNDVKKIPAILLGDDGEKVSEVSSSWEGMTPEERWKSL